MESLGVVSGFAELVKPVSNCLGLPEAQKLDFIKMIDALDLRPDHIKVFQGDPTIALRDIDNRPGLAKGRPRRAIQMKNRMAVFQFDEDETRTLRRIRLLLLEAAHMTLLGIRRTARLVSADQSVQE
jgi:hypothetical protein